MARFYLDEDVNIAVAPLLEQAGHLALTTPRAGNLGQWDADQLSFAVRQRRTLLTHNRRDYRALHEAWLRWSPRWRHPRPHSGILILDQPQWFAAEDYCRVVLDFLMAAPPLLDNLTFDWFARRGGEWQQWRPPPI